MKIIWKRGRKGNIVRERWDGKKIYSDHERVSKRWESERKREMKSDFEQVWRTYVRLYTDKSKHYDYLLPNVLRFPESRYKFYNSVWYLDFISRFCSKLHSVGFCRKNLYGLVANFFFHYVPHCPFFWLTLEERKSTQFMYRLNLLV